jgi:hypothetical protein
LQSRRQKRDGQKEEIESLRNPNMEIALTNGGVAIIDDADYPLVAGKQWRWWQRRNPGPVYAVTDLGTKMHRVILGLNDPKVLTDHRNSNGLDNRRENLRIATNFQSVGNRRCWGRIGLKGVDFYPKCTQRPYRARIAINGKPTHLGSFSTSVEAAIAYDEAARSIFGEFASVNFP